MTKFISLLIVLSILAFSSLSHAEDFFKPMFSSPSSVSSPQSYVILTTPGVHFTYGKGGGMSITSDDGGFTTFYPAFGHRSTVVPVPKIVHCVNTGSVSYCY